MNKFYNFILSLFCCAFAVSCAVGPDFESPDANLPDSWSMKDDGNLLTDDDDPKALSESELANWWNVFDDPILTSLVQRAFEGNLTIATARNKIDQARATLGTTQSTFFPAIDSNAAYKESGKTISSEGQTYSVGATTSWELDVFGGTRRGVESALASYKESLANKCASRISIAAEVAQNYFMYRAIQQQLIIVKNNLETQIKTAKVTTERKNKGFVSRLDIVRAQAQVETTRAKIPQLESDLALTRHSIELLLGVQTGTLKKELESSKDLPELEHFIPLGIPAKLLKRRPDIIAAEYAMHAATAKIGVARADFYPKFFITGNVSYQAPNIGDVVSNKYGSWSVGPSVSWNLFQGGKTYFNVQLQKALTEASEISWQLTVLKALKEVEDSIISAAKERERIVYLNAVVTNTKVAYELSLRLYTEGEAEFLDLLEAQRSMLEAQQTQILSRQSFIKYIITLYKSVGGGWTAKDLEDAGIKDSFLENYLDSFFTRDDSQKNASKQNSGKGNPEKNSAKKSDSAAKQS